MRWTRAFIPTLKETPSDAEIASHRLMLRAGMLRKLSSGIYNILPLGMKTTLKAANIVREEMDRTGAHELLMPVLSPAELWRESGRWEVYGDELMRIRDRHKRQFALGPTHEEIITDIVRKEVRSYRELPLTLYQIQTKFRDEIRPRFGVMRAREFMMKDAYSFHENEESLHETYMVMHEAYTRIFRRCGLDFGAVEADSGAIGGDVTHEFMVFAESGESQVLHCACGFSATVEGTSVKVAPAEAAGSPAKMEKVATPDMKTVEEVTQFMGVKPHHLVKTLIYTCQDQHIAAMVRGDREVSEEKLTKVTGLAPLELASPETIEKLTGAPLGFTGPVGLKGAQLVADYSVGVMTNMVTGANELDAHFRNVNIDRDFKPDQVTDIAVAEEGDPCPRCEKPLSSYRGIEVGQIFKLGAKYSESMGATYSDASGEHHPFVMGCYGIGVTRTVAAAIEQHHDEDGISWPMSLAPYEVHVLPVNVSNDEAMTLSDTLHKELETRGVDVLLDDREERAGTKFKDADLIGIPFRINVGERGLKKGVVELRNRESKEMTEVSVDDVVDTVFAEVAEARKKFQE
jgi:prolyl-tRNA synthetase